MHGLTALACLLGVGVAAVPVEAHGDPVVTDPDLNARPGSPDADLPGGAHRERRIKRWPLIAGGLGFGVPYVTSVGAAAIDGERWPTPWLNVPVAGPWIFVFRWRGVVGDSRGIDDPLPGLATFFSDVLLIVDGGLQAAGLVFLTYGALARDTVIVDDAHASREGLRLTPVPALLGDGRRGAPGLVVVGTF